MSRLHKVYRLHGAAWERLRNEMLHAANWRCATCGSYANEIDHIEPLHRGGAPWDRANLQVLCGGPAGCHAAKTRAENRRPLTPAEAEWRDFAAEMLEAPPAAT